MGNNQIDMTDYVPIYQVQYLYSSLALDTPLHETLLKKYAHQNHLEDKPMSKWLDVEIGVLPLSYQTRSDRRIRFERKQNQKHYSRIFNE